jgi:small subunit ribosomal protein S3
MSHTVHPYAHRLGILRDWKSRWFSPKGKYQKNLRGDVLIREYLEKKLKSFFVAEIEIERSGLIIGRQGNGAEILRENVKKLLKKHQLLEEKVGVKLDIKEIKSPEANASIVSQMVVEALEKRLPFRRVMKQTLEKVMANRDVKGVRILLAGRLGGATMSRTEDRKLGQIPLQTFRADVDFTANKAIMPYGTIGVKVWIYRGEVFEKDSK